MKPERESLFMGRRRDDLSGCPPGRHPRWRRFLVVAVGRTEISLSWRFPFVFGVWTELTTPKRYGVGIWITRGSNA